jgi:Protein of unknown function (DUF2946)
MRLLRAHQTSGAWLALVALLLQIAVSIAHVHHHELAPVLTEGGTNTSPLTRAARDGPGSPSKDHDFCMICASIALAGSLVLPQPVAFVIAVVPSRIALTDWVLVLVSTDQQRHFRARGPPV